MHDVYLSDYNINVTSQLNNKMEAAVVTCNKFHKFNAIQYHIKIDIVYCRR